MPAEKKFKNLIAILKESWYSSGGLDLRIVTEVGKIDGTFTIHFSTPKKKTPVTDLVDVH